MEMELLYHLTGNQLVFDYQLRKINIEVMDTYNYLVIHTFIEIT